MSLEKKEPSPFRGKDTPCRESPLHSERITPGRIPRYYDAFPRDCEFAYKTPGYYATGFGILDIYKTQVEFSEMRGLLFLEDPKQDYKWKSLKSRIPFPKSRVMDLPGMRDIKYHNYCLRSLTPDSAKSWRRSIQKKPSFHFDEEGKYKWEKHCHDSDQKRNPN